MIRTARLTLRRIRDSDLDPLHAIYADPRVMRYIGPPHPHRERTARMIESIRAADAETGLEFVVERAGQLIGRAGMWKFAEIGYAFHPDHWRRGFATEAVGAVVTAAFARHPRLSALNAEIDPRNRASAGLLARLGFREIDRVEKAVEIAGEWCDSSYWRRERPGPTRADPHAGGPCAAG